MNVSQYVKAPKKPIFILLNEDFIINVQMELFTGVDTLHHNCTFQQITIELFNPLTLEKVGSDLRLFDDYKKNYELLSNWRADTSISDLESKELLSARKLDVTLTDRDSSASDEKYTVSSVVLQDFIERDTSTVISLIHTVSAIQQ